MNTLENIKEQVQQLAKQINAPTIFLPTYGNSKRDGTPHIEVDGEIYRYIVYDRNVTSMNRQTLNMQELLYWIFQDITPQMGYDYEAKHRDQRLDSRRLAFQYQLDLLEKLDNHWKEKREQEINEILKMHPYSDKIFRNGP